MAKTGEDAASESLTAHLSRCFHSSQRRKFQAVETKNKDKIINNIVSVEARVRATKIPGNLHHSTTERLTKKKTYILQ